MIFAREADLFEIALFPVIIISNWERTKGWAGVKGDRIIIKTTAKKQIALR